MRPAATSVAAVLLLSTILDLLPVNVALCQTDETKNHTIRLSLVISRMTGIPTVAAVTPTGGDKYDIRVVFMGTVTNYQGVMGALIGGVAEITREASYRTDWCYISTRERGLERIKTGHVRKAQKLALDGDLNSSWRHFVAHLEAAADTEEAAASVQGSTGQPRTPPSVPVTSLEEFERSAFAKTYDVTKGTGWPIGSGEFNQGYRVRRAPDFALEIQTRSDRIVAAGLSFFNRSWLQESEQTLVKDFLGHLDPAIPFTPALVEYLRSAGTRQVPQIGQVNPYLYGRFKIFGGRVHDTLFIYVDGRR